MNVDYIGIRGNMNLPNPEARPFTQHQPHYSETHTIFLTTRGLFCYVSKQCIFLNMFDTVV